MNVPQAIMADIAWAAEGLVAAESEIPPAEFPAKRASFERAVAAALNKAGIYPCPKYLDNLVSGAIGAARMKRAEEARA